MLPTKLKYIDNYAQHAQVIAVLVMMFVGIIVLKNVHECVGAPRQTSSIELRHSP